MRRDITDWIGKDADRQRVYLTDAQYHAQAQVLSTTLDAIEQSLLTTLPRDAVAPAMVAAVVAVLGSIEAAERRTVDFADYSRRIATMPMNSGVVFPEDPPGRVD